MVSDNCVANSLRYRSEGVDDNNSNYGVRPVVALKSNVNVSQNGSGIWTLNLADSGANSIVLPRLYQKVEYTLYPWINKVHGKGGQIESFVITDQIRTNRNLITMKSGLVIYGGVARQLSDKTVDNNNSLLLLAGRSDSSSIITFRAYTARIYGLKLLEGDKLKRNFIPCYCTLSVTNVDGQSCPSGTIGLYDTVEEKFYTNQGTGTFLKGNDV